MKKADGIARRGLVLKLITALKQICNHPRQFLKKGKSNPELSGKSVLLLDLMKQIYDNGEKDAHLYSIPGNGKITGGNFGSHF